MDLARLESEFAASEAYSERRPIDWAPGLTIEAPDNDSGASELALDMWKGDQSALAW